MTKKLFSSESVTEGHPDKVCDQISDAVLDAILECDPHGRVACEVAAKTGLVLVMGEITTQCYVDIASIARKTILDIGYTHSDHGFDGNTCGVITSINEQSPDIAQGVNHALDSQTDNESQEGAGDQGMMFGFACNDTPSLMPMPIYLAHKLSRRLAAVRKEGILPWLRPDGKSQVTVVYEDGQPMAVDTVVVSAHHDADIPLEQIREEILREVIFKEIPDDMLHKDTRYLVNPTGRFVIGGPMGDSGLTGRKIIVDTYGGYARRGGGAFSGKDPTKVDRSAAYAARWVAKHIIAAGLASKCEIEIAYAIGVAEPVSILVETFGTGVLSEEKMEEVVRTVFDLRPAAIIRDLDLRRPIYNQVAKYGHFGRDDLNLPWEQLTRLDAVKKAAK